MSEYDEDLEILLQGFGDRILEYTKTLRGQLDDVEAELYRKHDELRTMRQRAQGHATDLSHIVGWLDEMERGRLTESRAMALIRGRLHGR